MNKLIKGCCLITSIVIAYGCSINPLPVKKEYLEKEIRPRGKVLEDYFDKRQEVANIAWPLLTLNTERCEEETVYDYGFTVTNKEKLPDEYKNAGGELYHVNNLPMVTTIVESGPAWNAGLRRWDEIIAVNNKGIKDNRHAIKKLKKVVENLSGEKEKTINLKIIRDERIRDINNIRPVYRCAYTIEVVMKKEIESFTYGKNIYVYEGLMDISFRTGVEFMIAHGMAHEIMNHPTKRIYSAIVAIAIDTFAGLKFDSWEFSAIEYLSNKIFVDHEVDADRLGLILMKNAGIDTKRIPDYWHELNLHYPEALRVLEVNTPEIKRKRYREMAMFLRE